MHSRLLFSFPFPTCKAQSDETGVCLEGVAKHTQVHTFRLHLCPKSIGDHPLIPTPPTSPVNKTRTGIGLNFFTFEINNPSVALSVR